MSAADKVERHSELSRQARELLKSGGDNGKAAQLVAELNANWLAMTPEEKERARELSRGTTVELMKSIADQAAQNIGRMRVGESFAHVACVFLQDWRAHRLTAEEVCDTLWAAAVARGLNKGEG